MDYSENIERFAKIAERYCTWADASESDAEADMKMARELLAELYVSVIGINDIGCGEELEHTVPVEDWKRILERFQKLPVDLYWSVFDPLEEEPPVLCSLADDLADIYRDIKVGLIMFKDGHIVEAVWQWRFDFSLHWAAHLTSAQRAIQSYLTYK